MAINIYGVDIEAVVLNANEQGINLQEIALVYEGLTKTEKTTMWELGLIPDGTGEDKCGTVIARFKSNGNALFSEKIKSVLYLAA